MAIVPTWTRGERMAKARKDAGLRQDQMAERLTNELGRKVSKSTVATWETGRHEPSKRNGVDYLTVMRTWASLTDVPLEWLLDVGVPESRYSEVPAGLDGFLTEFALDAA